MLKQRHRRIGESISWDLLFLAPLSTVRRATLPARGRVAWAQIEVENNRVRRIAMPTSGLACKHQLRGTGCRAGVGSDSTMKEVGARVQRKLFIGRITSARVRTAAPAVPRRRSRAARWDRYDF